MVTFRLKSNKPKKREAAIAELEQLNGVFRVVTNNNKDGFAEIEKGLDEEAFAVRIGHVKGVQRAKAFKFVL